MSDIRIVTWRKIEMIKARPLEIGSTRKKTMSVHSITDAVRYRRERKATPSFEVAPCQPKSRQMHLRQEHAINPPMNSVIAVYRRTSRQIHIRDGESLEIRWIRRGDQLSPNEDASYIEDCFLALPSISVEERYKHKPLSHTFIRHPIP